MPGAVLSAASTWEAKTLMRSRLFTSRPWRAAVLILVTAAFTGSAACSNKNSPSNNPTNFSGTVAIFATNSHSFTASKAGTITVKLTWSDGTVDLDLYATASTCTATDPILSSNPNCALLASSVASTGTQEQFTLTVTANQALTLWVDNFSQTKSQAYQLTVTPN